MPQDPERPGAQGRGMTRPLSREERQAAALRENLRRRKDQSRARTQADATPAPENDED
ncbi:MAG: hypothetical protein ACK4QW_17795 [Alphaproteobacteria bacterium]